MPSGRVHQVERPGGDEDEHRPPGHGSDEEIDEADDESFPASDAPQFWAGDDGDGEPT
jgi:hypothetical protein